MTARFTKPMSSEESTAFKKLIAPMVDGAIEDNGGIEAVRKVHAMMPSLTDFLAGWVARTYWGAFPAAGINERKLTQEQVRRIYDLVRLRLDTESLTS